MGFFSNLFKRKVVNALGIDIGSSSIKIVQLKKKGDKAILETYGELSLGPYGGASVGQSVNLSTEKLVQAMNDLLTEKEVALTTRTCGLAIPFKASLLSVVETPEIEEEEMDNMVKMEARKYIPVPISEVTLDWSIIPRKDTERKPLIKGEESIKTVDILLVAIHNNIIDQYKEISERTSLDPKFFEIEVFASMRSVLEGIKGPIMILDMGASTTKLYIIDRGLVYNSHIINRGSQDITANIARTLNVSLEDAEIAKRSIGMNKTKDGIDLSESVSLVAGSIFSEANRFLFDFQKRNKQNIKSIFLIGGGSALKGFRNLAAENFKVEVISGNPFENVEVPAFLENILKETGPEFTVATGSALRCLQEI
ncbi:MAG: type IV pilus assembly protein PilM [Candidatus Zambryskibacteria bacterium]|nr:type IV pilus assembly protein PilM [Candidatus Zambryskibacteria bacterium]